jgi:hypothetical protein
MQTHQIHVMKGRARIDGVRRALFDFPEVLEVFTTGRPDTVVVVYDGRPRLGAWLRHLRAAGYHVTTRPHARADAARFGQSESLAERLLRRAIVDNMTFIGVPQPPVLPVEAPAVEMPYTRSARG